MDGMGLPDWFFSGVCMTTGHDADNPRLAPWLDLPGVEITINRIYQFSFFKIGFI